MSSANFLGILCFSLGGIRSIFRGCRCDQLRNRQIAYSLVFFEIKFRDDPFAAIRFCAPKIVAESVNFNNFECAPWGIHDCVVSDFEVKIGDVRIDPGVSVLESDLNAFRRPLRDFSYFIGDFAGWHCLDLLVWVGFLIYIGLEDEKLLDFFARLI